MLDSGPVRTLMLQAMGGKPKVLLRKKVIPL
jgi:hypothetical protein